MKPARILATAALITLFGAGAARAELAPGQPIAPLLASVPATAALPQTAGKVVFLDFWASWCAPCKASFPAYGRMNTELSPKGLVVIAVSVDQDRGAYDAFIRKYAPPFYTLLDREQKLVQLAQVPVMPTSYLVGRDGRVRFVHQGFHGAETEAVVRRELELLLNESAP